MRSWLLRVGGQAKADDHASAATVAAGSRKQRSSACAVDAEQVNLVLGVGAVDVAARGTSGAAGWCRKRSLDNAPHLHWTRSSRAPISNAMSYRPCSASASASARPGARPPRRSRPRRSRLCGCHRARTVLTATGGSPRRRYPSNLRHGMSDARYDPSTIEPKWQALWEREHTWEVSNDLAGGAEAAEHAARNAYILEMLPYPSGEPHIGHLKNYALGDAIAHFRRRNGQRVLHPMGYDAFGLPAENHAIRTGVHPRQSTEESIAAFQRAFRSWGISIDWSREISTARPVVLPLDAVDLPAVLRARAGVSQGGRGQLVPARPDGAGQRAGDRRPLRALRRGRRAAPAGAVVLQDHRLRRPAAGRPGHDPLARARQGDAAQLDRPQRRRPGDVPLRVGRRPTTRCSRPVPTRCSARPSS